MKEHEKDHSKNKHEEGGGMAMRGVRRPTAEKQILKHHQQHQDKQEHDDDQEDKHQHKGMNKEMRENMLHHMQTL